GAWSKQERDIIMCVIRRQQIAELRKLVQTIDPQAFTVITDARGVYGKGFDNIAKED
ncbi:MAG: YitT family protein, partial [Oscillospiraceae bacterium]|nr:YitT family protein [Oscillospiraceae bacterium]